MLSKAATCPVGGRNKFGMTMGGYLLKYRLRNFLCWTRVTHSIKVQYRRSKLHQFFTLVYHPLNTYYLSHSFPLLTMSWMASLNSSGISIWNVFERLTNCFEVVIGFSPGMIGTLMPYGTAVIHKIKIFLIIKKHLRNNKARTHINLLL
jgi:hypothetical protein